MFIERVKINETVAALGAKHPADLIALRRRARLKEYCGYKHVAPNGAKVTKDPVAN